MRPTHFTRPHRDNIKCVGVDRPRLSGVAQESSVIAFTVSPLSHTVDVNRLIWPAKVHPCFIQHPGVTRYVLTPMGTPPHTPKRKKFTRASEAHHNLSSFYRSQHIDRRASSTVNSGTGVYRTSWSNGRKVCSELCEGLRYLRLVMMN